MTSYGFSMKNEVFYARLPSPRNHGSKSRTIISKVVSNTKVVNEELFRSFL